MFRQVTAIILLIAFATQTLERTFLVLDYYANTGAFAKNCENKLRPQLHCNGKCLLMKKLKEQEKKEQQSPERKSENKNEVFSSKSFFATLDALFVSIESNAYNTQNDLQVVSMPRSCFHPPTA